MSSITILLDRVRHKNMEGVSAPSFTIDTSRREQKTKSRFLELKKRGTGLSYEDMKTVWIIIAQIQHPSQPRTAVLCSNRCYKSSYSVPLFGCCSAVTTNHRWNSMVFSHGFNVPFFVPFAKKRRDVGVCVWGGLVFVCSGRMELSRGRHEERP